MSLSFSTAVILACAKAFAQNETEIIAGRHYQELIQKGRVIAAAFATVQDGKVTGSRIFGNANPDSLWRGASATKTLTALVTMRLVEKGRLDLHRDINEYLKTFRVPANMHGMITVHHLLTHTSGLDDRFVGSAFLDGAPPQPPLTVVMREWMPLRLYEPGQVQLYSNFGYGLLGAVLEEVTGQRYEDLLRNEVLDPLGMSDTTAQQPLPESVRARLVKTNERSMFGSIHPASALYHRATSGGGITTSLGDTLRLVKMVQNHGAMEGTPFLKKETLDLMLGEGSETSYGFGFGISRGERYWYAGGDLGGYHMVILWFPEHRKAFATMAASYDAMATTGLTAKVMERWFGPEKQPKAGSVRPHVNAKEFATRVAGVYRPIRYPHFDISKTFTITMDQTARALPDGALRFGGERWIAVDPLKFRHESEERYLKFQEDSAGRVRFLNRSLERLRWYETGRAAIAAYFGSLLIAALALWKWRTIRWLACAVLIHSVTWLGSVLIADPQRLILGSPWYLDAALLFGAMLPLLLLYLLMKVRSSPLPIAIAIGLFSVYLLFISYWRLTAIPLL